MSLWRLSRPQYNICPSVTHTQGMQCKYAPGPYRRWHSPPYPCSPSRGPLPGAPPSPTQLSRCIVSRLRQWTHVFRLEGEFGLTVYSDAVPHSLQVLPSLWSTPRHCSGLQPACKKTISCVHVCMSVCVCVCVSSVWCQNSYLASSSVLASSSRCILPSTTRPCPSNACHSDS